MYISRQSIFKNNLTILKEFIDFDEEYNQIAITLRAQEKLLMYKLRTCTKGFHVMVIQNMRFGDNAFLEHNF